MRFHSLNKQKGFTLAELSVVVVMIGVMGVIFSSYIEGGQTLYNSNLNLKNERINQQIASALVEYAESRVGRLPAPFTSAGQLTYSSILDETSNANDVVELRNLITQRGIDVDEINDDGRGLENVRVYQTVEDIVVNTPFFGSAGDMATLTYDIGVVYHTQCSRFDPVCNTDAGTDLPGESPEITAANYEGWQNLGTDGAPGRISTLQLQRDLLRTTRTTVQQIRSQLRSFFNALQSAALPGSADNFYPFPQGAGALDLSGIAAPNQGCLDGWYLLTNGDTSVLDQLGLGEGEYSVTSFGGRIEYCRDYDPTAVDMSPQGVPPHNAALRINRDLTSASAPSGAVANNIIFSL